MKNTLYLLLLLPLVLFSCDKSTSVAAPELVKAESLTLTDADSTLTYCQKTTEQTDLYATYFRLGCAYLKLHQLDSAAYYLIESTQQQNYKIKAGAYRQLYDLEKLRGNYKQAIVYNDLHLQYRDSANNMELKKSVAEIESKYNYAKQQNAIKEVKLKKSIQEANYIYLMSGLLLVIISIYVLFQKYLRQKEKELSKHKEKLRLRKKQLEMNEIQIKNNQVLITSNNKKLETLLSTSKIEFEEKLNENKALIKQNEVLMLENEKLCLDISKKETELKEGKVYENRIREMNMIKKHLIQVERSSVERSISQHSKLKPLLLCKQERIVYKEKNWEEVICIIDGFYDGVITKLKKYFSLSNDDILACSLLLIGFRNVEIAYVTGSDVSTMHKRIERLAKKLQTPKNEDLIIYLLGDLRVKLSANVDSK